MIRGKLEDGLVLLKEQTKQITHEIVTTKIENLFIFFNTKDGGVGLSGKLSAVTWVPFNLCVKQVKSICSTGARSLTGFKKDLL